MQYTNARSALNEYNTVNLQGGIIDADPHRLIQMLYEGALTKLANAQAAMRTHKTADKGEAISSAILIIEGLNGLLDHDVGGDIATNLSALYGYMTRTLVDANVHDDMQKLEEVAGLIKEVKAGWDEISMQSARQQERA
ncbi:MAG: flagellar export chaperone FliS [bacterium]